MAYYLFSLNKGLILSNELKDPSFISNLKNREMKKPSGKAFKKSRVVLIHSPVVKILTNDLNV